MEIEFTYKNGKSKTVTGDGPIPVIYHTLGVRGLFSHNVRSDSVFGFTEDIQDLCNSYTGEFVELKRDDLSFSSNINNGKTVTNYELYYDVITTSSRYYFSIFWVAQDDNDLQNEGFTSLVCQKHEEGVKRITFETWPEGITIF